jgi:hypothetical protein
MVDSADKEVGEVIDLSFGSDIAFPLVRHEGLFFGIKVGRSEIVSEGSISFENTICATPAFHVDTANAEGFIRFASVIGPNKSVWASDPAEPSQTIQIRSTMLSDGSCNPTENPVEREAAPATFMFNAASMWTPPFHLVDPQQ